MPALMIHDRQGIATSGAIFQWHAALIADFRAIARSSSYRLGKAGGAQTEFGHENVCGLQEASCGGAAMDVYLRGEEVCKLEWWIEESNQSVREEYFFRGARAAHL